MNLSLSCLVTLKYEGFLDGKDILLFQNFSFFCLNAPNVHGYEHRPFLLKGDLKKGVDPLFTTICAQYLSMIRSISVLFLLLFCF